MTGALLFAALRTSTAAQPARPGAPDRAKTVYEKHCVECHGATGKGDGPAAPFMTPRPRDFTAAKYKIRSTETGSLPSDTDLLRSVRLGLTGSAMPGWQGLLSEEDIAAVIGYVKAFSPRFAKEALSPIAQRASAPATPAAIGLGAAVYGTLQCGKCHGTDGRGTDAAATAFEDDWGQPVHAADLTEPWTFRGGSTAADIFMRFRAGMSGTPMPSFKDAATDQQMWDLALYVVSLARKPVWEMNPSEVKEFYAGARARAKAQPVTRGRYLVETLGCALCHSPTDADKRPLPGMMLAGGLRIRVEPYGDFATGNLTSDKETGLGNWTDAEIKRAVTQGTLRNGTRLLPYPMDWASFSTMPDEDLDAIVAYLRTVPPVRNKVPPPDWTFLPLHLWGKFRMLILGGDPPMTFFAGNAGTGREAAR